MDLSIIIVNWNTKAMLLECLESIEPQLNDIKAEIIVVDNASSDGSVEGVEEKFPHVKIIKNTTNLGFAKANNIGMQNSVGRYICLVNSDIVARKGCFKIMMDYMDQNPAAGLLGPKLLNADLSLQWSCKRFPTLWNNFCVAIGLDNLLPQHKLFCGEHMKFFPHDSLLHVDALVGAFLMARREAIEHVGLLDENFFMYGEEIDWCKRLHMQGYDVVFLPSAEVIHYGAGSSSKEPIKFYKELHESKLKYWKKHHNKRSQIGFKIIVLFRQITRLSIETFKCASKHRNKSSSETKIKGYIDVINWVFQGR